ncbi:hypothetical protein VSS86_22165, partial [Bacillus safensis]|uniref:hypothetical protein n=1 Tax=Bacillus safensis TaxID=561879 RepID=UPI002DD444FA
LFPQPKKNLVGPLDPLPLIGVQRANQIFLLLRKEVHDREKEPAEKDIREAAQGAQWLREVVERHSDGLEQAYEDALSKSGLP